jgi:hypothetical protein
MTAPLKFPAKGIHSLRSAATALLRRVGLADVGRYRPEKHYMRGHGPKSQLQRSHVPLDHR